MRTTLCRMACLLTALGSSAIVWQVHALSSQTGRTPLMMLVLIAGGAATLFALALATAPGRIWKPLRSRMASFIAKLRALELPSSRRIGSTLFVVGTTTFLGITIGHLSQPDDPTDDDQSAFLERAAEVHARGGPVSLIRDLYAGDFLEANRHPLYIGMLSIHPTQSFGRWLSFTIGLATLALLTWLISQQHGMTVAGIFCLLLGTNGAFCLFSTRAVCDVLMVLWGGLAYRLIARQQNRNVTRAIMLGVVLGLAYLTKGTGLLLFIGYFGWLIALGLFVFHKSGPCSSDAAAKDDLAMVANPMIVCLAWAITVSPLVVRNTQINGGAFYNVNSYLLFVDEFEDPVQLAERQSLPEAAREYLRTHSFGDIARREASGLVWESFIVLRILGPALLEDARVLVGLPLFLCALIAVIAHPRREHALLVAWIIICVPLFAWYIPVAAGDRFPLPLLAPLLMLAAEGIVRLTRLRLRKINPAG